MRARWPHTTTDKQHLTDQLSQGQQELQGEPKCRQRTTGQELQSPCGTNADSRILYFSNTFLLLPFHGAKRLAFNGVVDWVTGLFFPPCCSTGAFLIFLLLFHISFFFLPRRMEHGATNKRRFTGSDPHMNFSDSPSPLCFFFFLLL